MTPMRSRFRCPRCGEVLTPWSRELELAEALNPFESQTWLLPAQWFVRWDHPGLRDSYLGGHPASYPWLFAPLTRWWVQVHPDSRRTAGCCGLAYGGSGPPNLVCACGLEIGVGHRDCSGPHWYALHESVVHEQEVDATPLQATAGRLARLRYRVGRPVARPGHDPGGGNVWHHERATWNEALRLRELTIDCGGGIEDPALVIESPQLPPGAQLVVPLPWCQLVRLAALGEQPWGEAESPLTWMSGLREGPHVCVSRYRRRVLLTAWGPDPTSWAVTIEVRAWADAWAWL
ncbi:hypothetical protein OV203_49255 [Nannocystis sp. ILAH1]|uniref:hypothetical protein n=1 Tax=unclassified Nannocystis TaxID=2627009 RepID=UPI00226FCAD5|nr:MULTISPECIES: hypothetical protein [unclassified Nannocystis]MCY0995212.1 hypothetical protein [Nannocystis sp. ILAH1]MCY1068165.1 hypothetical protein [Nannocystis sp. RBIL2]